ncbi:hypothetical protein [Flavobacterium sp.]|uniref:hypothetical protein n=1 Tax=Flavobacterium sp. TaxID=239 RepID=UPI00262E2425|nr:hypothetical protein [Flavobacterium sp.]
MKNLNQISFTTLFAIGSFLIGTLLFAWYMFIPSDGLLITGFLYVSTAVVLNLIIFINLLYKFIITPNERTETAIRILILISNIPIAYMYFNLVFIKI